MYLSNTDISYVYVEAIPKGCVRSNIPVSDCSKELITGVLAGIKEDKYGGVTTTFILVHDMLKDVRYSLNSTVYNIISVDKAVETGKRFFTFYSSSKEDQEQSLTHIDSIIESLDVQGKCFLNRKEIDISKYTNMPVTMAPRSDSKSEDKKEDKTPLFKSNSNRGVKLGFDCRTKNAYIPPPGPEALFYRRKSDKPNLKAMRGWVRQVMAKKYEEPKIKEIEVEETTTAPTPKSKVMIGYDDDYANGVYGY